MESCGKSTETSVKVGTEPGNHIRPKSVGYAKRGSRPQPWGAGGGKKRKGMQWEEVEEGGGGSGKLQ
ncbi:hypothetical protein Cadr_000012524 [Camelus dromedarius]|uniref:Uncharacterized protein n=1 Tax=Camelus dromedarius TaxID=9838 RepID=A0A5N4D956_CAMDR|nr:hypothetical protein Cadr_000012524 [Camelus dromedarius]